MCYHYEIHSFVSGNSEISPQNILVLRSDVVNYQHRIVIDEVGIYDVLIMRKSLEFHFRYTPNDLLEKSVFGLEKRFRIYVHVFKVQTIR